MKRRRSPSSPQPEDEDSSTKRARLLASQANYASNLEDDEYLTELEAYIDMARQKRAFSLLHPPPMTTPSPPFRDIVFDVETTGLGADAQIVEIGAIELEDGVETGVYFHSLATPSIPISPAAAAIHGIDEPRLRALNAPPLATALASFAQWIGPGGRTRFLVAHNAPFDSAVLARNLDHIGLPQLPVHDILCTLSAFRSSSFYAGGGRTDLESAVAASVGVQPPKRGLHSALQDAVLTTRLYQSLHPKSASSSSSPGATSSCPAAKSESDSKSESESENVMDKEVDSDTQKLASHTASAAVYAALDALFPLPTTTPSI